MKVFKKITWSILFASCFAVFTACSSDDDAQTTETNPQVNPSAVLTGGLPKSVNGMFMTYTGGLLTRVTTNDGIKVTFEYSDKIKSNSTGLRNNSPQDLKMTIEYDGNPEDTRSFDMIIGKNGFVESCTQTNADSGETDTWQFGYNSEGNLNYMKRSEGGNEVTTITYKNGNITAVSMVSEEDNNTLNTQVSYTSENVQTAIENKGCIMLFDETFGIDMDEMKYAYWAGLLGKATKHLPVKTIYTLEDETETFQWNLKNGYPEKLTKTTSWDTENYLFSW